MRATLFLVALSCLVSQSWAGANYPPIPADKTTPTQQRIALFGPRSISVGWNTYEQLAEPCVDYGLSPSKLTSSSCSKSSITYPTSRTWANTVILSDLKPATKYFYKIRSTNSTTDFFKSGRLAGDKTPFTMNSIIDLGVYGEDGYTLPADDKSKRSEIPEVNVSLNHTTIGALAKTIDQYELIIHPGDWSYSDDWYYNPKNVGDEVNAYEAIQEQFFQQLAPIAGRVPYAAGIGNHEITCNETPGSSCPQGQTNASAYINRFGETMPTSYASTSSSSTAKAAANKAKALSKPPFWYSFEYGMVHVTMVNSETDYENSKDGPGTVLNGGNFGAPGQQLAWLEADLQSVDRTVTPWVIVAEHRPWYSSGGSKNICSPCQKAFEPLIYKYGVDAVVGGHIHNSQLIRPTFNNTIDPAGYKNPKAPLYIVSGGTGNVEGLTPVGTKPKYVDYAYASDFSYASFSFLSSKELRVDYHRSATGEILHSATLTKDRKEAFVRQ